MKSLTQNWFFKHKLYHIPFWCLYHYLWWTVAVGNPLKAASSIFFLPYSVKYLFYVLLEAAAVYFNFYYLMPRLFKKGSYALYFTILTAVIALTALGIVAGYYLSSSVTGKSLRELYGNGSNCFYYFLGFALPSAFASMTLAMTIKLLKNRILEENRQEQIRKEKMETELQFLKNQFNPHFLFNSINSIFILIRRNPELASSALAKFSALLRHQLYECNDLQIPLSKEISYLNNYVELERLRQNAGLTVDARIPLLFSDTLVIAPFILMTFVENAFKHVLKDPEQPSNVYIQLALADHSLTFIVGNTNSLQSNPLNAGGGVGLKNVQRRLELLYPQQFTLAVKNLPDWYEVRLELTLQKLINVPPLEMAF